MTLPFMPKATAIWLIDNTTLTFEQIAEFCGMHFLEIKCIADGDVAANIKGLNPIQVEQLTKDEISRCEADKNTKLRLTKSATETIEANQASNNKKSKYTPVARRENKPNAIAWLLKNCPEITERQIARLVGSTTPTVISIKNRTHWDMPNISPKDPILLGICSRVDLETQLAHAKTLKADAYNNEKK